MVLSQLTSCFVAVHDRHLDIHQNNIEGTVGLLCCHGESTATCPFSPSETSAGLFEVHGQSMRMSRPSSTSKIRQFSLLPVCSVSRFAPFSESRSRTPPTKRRGCPLNLQPGKQAKLPAKSRTAQEGLRQSQGELIKCCGRPSSVLNGRGWSRPPFIVRPTRDQPPD